MVVKKAIKIVIACFCCVVLEFVASNPKVGQVGFHEIGDMLVKFYL